MVMVRVRVWVSVSVSVVTTVWQVQERSSGRRSVEGRPRRPRGSGRARGNACCTAAPAPATCQPLLRWPCEHTADLSQDDKGQMTKDKGRGGSGVSEQVVG